jgi:hypothetical protein
MDEPVPELTREQRIAQRRARIRTKKLQMGMKAVPCASVTLQLAERFCWFVLDRGG